MLDQIPAALKSFLFAAVMAYIRLHRDEEPKPIRQFIESFFCGAIAVTIFYLVKALGLENFEDYAVFLGGAVGMLGSDFIRSIARQLTKKHSGVGSDGS